MEKKIIRFCYRKIIDAAAQKTWDKYVFESSYAELLMQFQLYNPGKKYMLFSDLLWHVPAAEKLHFIVSASVTGYIQQLNGQLPDITNNLGNSFLRFKGYRFEIIDSDIRDRAKHVVAVNFFSEPLLWQQVIGNYLLVSPLTNQVPGEGILTHLVTLQPFFSIYSINEEVYD
jgi:hypothetical protein